MPRKDTTRTPRSTIKGTLQRLFVRSRERSTAMRASGYTCTECGLKQSTAKGRKVKLCVHHMDLAKLNELTDMVYEYLLHRPEKLQPLCKDCHDLKHPDGIGAKKTPR
jgi:predicted HNH restriction endonuclease